MKILVVDDDDVIRENIVEMIAMAGSNRTKLIASASCCREAYGHLAKNDFHTVLLDHSLPDGNGFEILDRIVSTNAGTRCIMVTSMAYETSYNIDAKIKGAHAVLKKPFRANQLLSLVFPENTFEF